MQSIIKFALLLDFQNFGKYYVQSGASQVALVVKKPPVKAGDIKDTGSTHGLERSPGGEHNNPLQYSRLENPMDRGNWKATIHGVAKELDTTGRLNNNCLKKKSEFSSQDR